MALPELSYNFHDAGLISVELGPRREVTLVVALDDPGQPRHLNVRVRFGGISNFSDVEAFCARVPKPVAPCAYLTQVEELNYDSNSQSTHGNLSFALELEYVGSIVIRCRNVDEDRMDSAGELDR